ncbi:MAG: hypothetical protein NC299_09065 [Lachnospiraceae bacterium]|nr:hypothetical protein [Lachnospiraceae bacterium]
MNEISTKFYETRELAVDVIGKSAFLDKIGTHRGESVYLIEATVIRLSPKALNMWLEGAHPCNRRECYNSEEEYQAYLAEINAMKKECEDFIKKALGIAGNCTITQNESEIFTVVKMHKVAENADKPSGSGEAVS